jgi:hypothetical protein
MRHVDPLRRILALAVEIYDDASPTPLTATFRVSSIWRAVGKANMNQPGLASHFRAPQCISAVPEGAISECQIDQGQKLMQVQVNQNHQMLDVRDAGVRSTRITFCVCSQSVIGKGRRSALVPEAGALSPACTTCTVTLLNGCPANHHKLESFIRSATRMDAVSKKRKAGPAEQDNSRKTKKLNVSSLRFYTTRSIVR